MLPDQLYQFAVGKDAAGSRIDVVPSQQVLTGAFAASVTSTALIVPQDRICILTAIFAAGTPGAGQNCTQLRIQFQDSTGQSIGNLLQVFQAAGGGAFSADRQFQLWLPPLYRIQAIATFDAGVNQNFATLSATGLTFPRGNVNLGSLGVQ